MKKNTQTKKKSNMFYNIVFILVCLVIVGAFSRLIDRQSNRYNALRTVHDQIERQFAEERARYYTLSYQIAHFDSDAYIERLARERLGWARPNEIIFRQRTAP
ncbi:MAG: septum formation initiator family protein [Defluviitaleaceae bacterium]|nr:septum formation initiator family protein [Defluviitaleaceae bacterium]